MAGMLAPSLGTLPDVALGGRLRAAGRLVRRPGACGRPANGIRALAGGHCAPHLVHSGSMLYMFLAVAPAAAAGEGHERHVRRTWHGDDGAEPSHARVRLRLRPRRLCHLGPGPALRPPLRHAARVSLAGVGARSACPRWPTPVRGRHCRPGALPAGAALSAEPRRPLTPRRRRRPRRRCRRHAAVPPVAPGRRRHWRPAPGRRRRVPAVARGDGRLPDHDERRDGLHAAHRALKAGPPRAARRPPPGPG